MADAVTDSRLTVDQCVSQCVSRRVGRIRFFTFTILKASEPCTKNVDISNMVNLSWHQEEGRGSLVPGIGRYFLINVHSNLTWTKGTFKPDSE